MWPCKYHNKFNETSTVFHREKEESTSATVTATDIPVLNENTVSEARVQNHNLHRKHKKSIPVLLPASPIKQDPSTLPPTHL